MTNRTSKPAARSSLCFLLPVMSIKLKAMLVIFLFVASMLAATGSTYFIVRSQKDDALIINVSGRQRMLIQSMAKEALSIDYAEDHDLSMEDNYQNIKELIQTFDMNLETLEKGGALILPDGSSLLIKSIKGIAWGELETFRREWLPYKKSLMIILNKDVRHHSEAYDAALSTVLKIKPSLSGAADELTALIQLESEKKHEITKNVQTAALAITVILGLFSYLFLRKSILKPVIAMNNTVRRIGEGEIHSRCDFDSNDEIGLLSNGINRMAVSLSEREEAILKANDRLTRKRNRLIELARLREGFLSRVTHELKTPLTAILGNSDLLLSDVVSPLTAEQREMISDIKEGGDELLDQLNDLLNFSEIEAESSVLVPEDVSIQSLITDIVEEGIKLSSGKPVNVSAKAEGAPLTIRADGKKLREILHCLMSNAVKFTAKGEVSLEVRDHKNGLLFSVSDTGAGIATGDIATAFEPFRQLENVLNRVHGGTGLGLAIVKYFVELHGGEVRIESEPGNGTSVLFTIPAVFNK